MREYIIMTDSCADLTAAEVQAMDLTVVPLHYELDGVTYVNYPDHSELDSAEFFARVSAGAACKTSAVSVGDFVDTMGRISSTSPFPAACPPHISPVSLLLKICVQSSLRPPSR